MAVEKQPERNHFLDSFVYVVVLNLKVVCCPVGEHRVIESFNLEKSLRSSSPAVNLTLLSPPNEYMKY